MASSTTENVQPSGKTATIEPTYTGLTDCGQRKPTSPTPKATVINSPAAAVCPRRKPCQAASEANQSRQIPANQRRVLLLGLRGISDHCINTPPNGLASRPIRLPRKQLNPVEIGPGGFLGSSHRWCAPRTSCPRSNLPGPRRPSRSPG